MPWHDLRQHSTFGSHDPAAISEALAVGTTAEDARVGAPRGATGQWASCLRVIDPASLATASVTELEFNEAALSLCLVKFSSAPQLGTVLAVGTVQSLTFYPREVKEGFIRLYQVHCSVTGRA